jgi:transmembrane 9 superfamily member 3
MARVLVGAVFSLLAINFASADESTHIVRIIQVYSHNSYILTFAIVLTPFFHLPSLQYQANENVVIWLSKVGPYHNPQETYSYYALPFCKPSKKLEPETRIGGLGEILEGNDLMNSDIPLVFKQNVDHSPICSMELDDQSAQLLAFAVSNHYWYQMFIDELPLWGMVGEIVAEEDAINEIESHLERPHGIAEATFLYTHKNFTIAYNGENIIEVNMTAEGAVPIESGRSYSLTYSVQWVESDMPFERRFDRYLDGNFFEHQIHWFSLFNSFMMVVFLCGLVALILMRTLKADYARYMREDEDAEAGNAGGSFIDKGIGDDSGWKQVHGDVFRRPPHLALYAALVGTGTQLLLLGGLTILAAFAGSLYIDRGAIAKAVVLGYSLTSAIAGYISGRLYRGFFFPEPSPSWITVMILSASLFPSLVFITIGILNTVAWSYGTTTVLSWITIGKIFLLWAFISFPLAVLGTIYGRRMTPQSHPQTPTRVNAIPRPIPSRPWYLSNPMICLAAGLLPFGSIFIETYFVFTSFWNYKFYYVYGFMLAVYIILAIVVSCVTVVVTYFLLNSEDHHWRWQSFFAGASTGLYVFLYSMYYFFFRTEMTGLLQTVYYFGYTSLASTAIALTTGIIGTSSASMFVHAIFSSIKVD